LRKSYINTTILIEIVCDENRGGTGVIARSAFTPIFATKASEGPPERMGDGVVGKLLDEVFPVTYALADASTAMPRLWSNPAPPR
jgi:hypothetical protein